MFLLYIRLLDDKEINVVPCKFVVESKLLGDDFLELHGVDERIKDDNFPKNDLKILVIRKSKIEHMCQLSEIKEEPVLEIKEEVAEVPKEQPKKPTSSKSKVTKPKTKRKYVKSGKYAQKK